MGWGYWVGLELWSGLWLSLSKGRLPFPCCLTLFEQPTARCPESPHTKQWSQFSEPLIEQLLQSGTLLFLERDNKPGVMGGALLWVNVKWGWVCGSSNVLVGWTFGWVDCNAAACWSIKAATIFVKLSTWALSFSMVWRSLLSAGWFSLSTWTLCACITFGFKTLPSRRWCSFSSLIILVTRLTMSSSVTWWLERSGLNCCLTSACFEPRP